VSMSNPTDRVEIITSVQRHRRWTASEKVRIVEETFEPGMTVSLVARRHGVANQLFTWRRLVVEGALTAAGSGETGGAGLGLSGFAEPGALQRLLGKKTLEAETSPSPRPGSRSNQCSAPVPGLSDSAICRPYSRCCRSGFSGCPS
jgi:transposase